MAERRDRESAAEMAKPMGVAERVEFELSDEQRSLRAVARQFCEQQFPEPEVRRLMETADGFDRQVWQRLGRDMGLLALTTPHELGGAGAGLVDLALVAEELGRAVACAPFVGTVALAGTALKAATGAGDADARAAAVPLLARIAAGEAVVSLAATDARGAWQPARATVTATRTGAGWRLAGEQAYVLDGAAADAVLVLADTGGGQGLFLVEAVDGLAREAQSGLDLTRRQARLRYEDVPAVLVAEPGVAPAAVAAARDTAAVVLAAEAVGGAQRLLDMSVEYARTRLQFGRTIGSFQAVKHRCADMLVEVEHARSAAYHAAWAADAGTDEPRLAADLATVVAAETYLRVAKSTVQVHGGIGFTWEHPTHLYYKRAASDAALLGGRAAAAERLADAVLEPVPAP